MAINQILLFKNRVYSYWIKDREIFFYPISFNKEVSYFGPVYEVNNYRTDTLSQADSILRNILSDSLATNVSYMQMIDQDSKQYQNENC